MSKHVMIDIETLGRSHDAAVIQVGLTKFSLTDQYELNPIIETRDWTIMLEDALVYGKVDADTLMWWLKQTKDEPELYRTFFDPWAVAQKICVEALCGCVGWSQLDGVWTNAPSFDFPILKHAIEAVGAKVPWTYRQERCSRSLFWYVMDRWPSLADQLPTRKGILHSAKEDSIYQAEVLIWLMQRINQNG